MFTQNMRSHARPTNNAKKVRQWFSFVWLKNGQIWPKTSIFDQMWAFLAHLIQRRPKNNSNKLPRCFFPLCGYQDFCFLPKELGFLAQKRSNLAQKYVFLVILGQILAFLAHFVPCLTKIQCKQGAQVVIPLCGYQYFCFLL